MRIALLTDAWKPQVNGVVTALTALVRELEAAGHDVLVIHPGLFVTVPCPTYREIRLAAAPLPGVATRMQRFMPDAVHIATEGSVGLAGWLYCLIRRWHFTTSFHTRFPEYLNARWPFLPVSLGYRVLSQFHRRAVRSDLAALEIGLGEFQLAQRILGECVQDVRVTGPQRVDCVVA